jgi:hypothetical protein
MSDKPPPVTTGELFKQMAAIHAQIARLRYKPGSQSHATELARLNAELARLSKQLFPGK